MANHPSLSTLPVSHEGKRVAKHLALAARAPLHRVVDDALQLLKQQWGVSDPPEIKSAGAE